MACLTRRVPVVGAALAFGLAALLPGLSVRATSHGVSAQDGSDRLQELLQERRVLFYESYQVERDRDGRWTSTLSSQPEVSFERTGAGSLRVRLQGYPYTRGVIAVARFRYAELVPLGALNREDREWFQARNLVLPALHGQVAYRRVVKVQTGLFRRDGDVGTASVLVSGPSWKLETQAVDVEFLVLGPAGTGPGALPAEAPVPNPGAPLPEELVRRHDWRSADIVFPKGTTLVKFHLDDSLTYSDDRRCYMSMRIEGRRWGWGCYVFPDAFTERTGKENSDFFFGVPGIEVAQGIPVPDGFEAAEEELHDGSVWNLLVTCDRAETKTFFGHCFDGALEIAWPDNAAPLVKGGPRHSMTLEVGETASIRFSVATE